MRQAREGKEAGAVTGATGAFAPEISNPKPQAPNFKWELGTLFRFLIF
jgi:hypothetical protein